MEINLPLADGSDAVMTGTCLEKIAHKFPDYEFDGAVKEDILDCCRNNGINTDSFPLFPRKAGDEIDIMIGMACRKYTPPNNSTFAFGMGVMRITFHWS